ncbi:hypothetical protein [Tenacibaculum finnmarkense]|uniref:Phage membrane protein n=1 Tax=Tenacibaculum finnmarkense genomovar finnmarkense TaxID=1458503 RepID=A0AAP1RHB1_9FLAO|nr:hypothetical protein [Tenacibaculum finnmarkense]MBE7654001.1 hypothetical protein [Tenacibaculum finnmarkense genomovar finnmarkense]MBE7696301.1 hypothetical protein [Tenacibaculum finnmarkense genomovar finnmarkense]MCD8428546.1 hypothetical protein [Tenacibaculum finnmarkense genomovar finnmarkense]MCD8440957.1 hypothetical protein [Tenacibaculum finnmarkense genomovar ulcerans]MCG8721875.1 hypothetical protein [Tenacibaculum finnmarkense]
MIESEFNTVDLSYESYKFREELRNQLLLQANYSYEPGMWEYEGKWYFSKFDLYIAILAYEIAEQFGILDIVGLIAVLSGAPLIPTRAKFKGSIKGTSVASKYLSKIPGELPFRVPTVIGYPKIIGGKGLKKRLTKIIGRIVGRATPIIGWGILTYDLGSIFYDTQMVYNHIVDGK